MRHGRFPRPHGRPAAWMAMSLLSIFVVLVSETACRAATDLPSHAYERSGDLSRVIAGVATRSTDLNYITEQDSEVFAFYRNTQVKELTDTVFLTLLRRPKETMIFQQSWPTFFQLRTQNDPTGRWRQLQEYLEANLTNLTVFRLPREAPYESQYDLYAVGIFKGNIVVGVQMFGVAT